MERGRRKEVVTVHELKVTGLIPWTKWGKVKRSRNSQSSLSNHCHSALQQGTFTAGDCSSGAAQWPAAAPRSVIWTCVKWMNVKAKPSLDKKTNVTKQNKKRNISSSSVSFRLPVWNASTANISKLFK